MKQSIRFLLFLSLLSSFYGDVIAQKGKKNKSSDDAKSTEMKKLVLKNEIDSVSYAIGMNMTTSIKKDFSEVNFDAFIEGIRAGMEGKNYVISPDQIQNVVGPYFQKKQEVAQKEERKRSEKIKEDGLKFLAENKKKEGVVTTESGLQYLVLKEGEGKQPNATSSVTVHYHGTTPEGVVFDSSVERGQPATFGLNQVIKGWTEGVALMKEGAKYKFFIPQELAYGANPRPGGAIKPYMPLVFEVELIKVND